MWGHGFWNWALDTWGIIMTKIPHSLPSMFKNQDNRMQLLNNTIQYLVFHEFFSILRASIRNAALTMKFFQNSRLFYKKKRNSRMLSKNIPKEKCFVLNSEFTHNFWITTGHGNCRFAVKKRGRKECCYGDLKDVLATDTATLPNIKVC